MALHHSMRLMQGGEILTRQFKFKGKRLVINYSTSAVGSIQFEIKDEAGNPAPGFALKECKELWGDEIERTVSWKTGSDLAALQGKVIRLHIVMKDADLFSFRFAD